MQSNINKKLKMGIRRSGKDYEEMPGTNVPVTQRIPDPDDYMPPSSTDFEMFASSVSVVPDGKKKDQLYARDKNTIPPSLLLKTPSQ